MGPVKTENNLFPVFLKLDGRHVLIVGGGKTAYEKIQTVVRNSPGAFVFVVSPEAIPEIREMIIRHPQIKWFREKFNHRHLAGMNLVITATGIRNVAEEVKERCDRSGIWVNTADVPGLCDFYLGSVVNKGNLKIAISTNGKSPVLARRLRECLDEEIPEEVSQCIERLHAFRLRLKNDIANRLKVLNQITEVLVSVERE